MGHEHLIIPVEHSGESSGSVPIHPEKIEDALEYLIQEQGLTVGETELSVTLKNGRKVRGVFGGRNKKRITVGDESFNENEIDRDKKGFLKIET